MWVSGLSVAAGILGFCAARYRVALPNQRIVRTGLGIQGMQISQKCIHWPFQQLRVLDLTPFTVKVRVAAMSKHRIEFDLPTVWTLAPDTRTLNQFNQAKAQNVTDTTANVDSPISKVSDVSPLELYARRLMTMGTSERSQFFEQYIQGEARIIAGNMDLDDLASNRQRVQEELTNKLAADFERVGVVVLNGNIEDLHDKKSDDGKENNNYFFHRKQRALKEAESAAKVATSEAERIGNVGKAEADAKSKMDVARHNREGLVAENQQQEQEWISRAKLAEVQSDSERKIAIAKATQVAETERTTSELQKKVEEARLEQHVAKERAANLSTIQVEAESALARANGEANATVARAKAHLEAERLRAAGILAVLEAQASGLKSMVDAAGGDMSRLVAYLFTERKGQEELGKTFAQAVQDLKPNITVWSRGGNNNSDDSAGQSVTNFLGMMPHFLKTVEQQTGFQILPQLFSKSDTPQIPPKSN